MKVSYLSDIHAEFLNYPNLHNDQRGYSFEACARHFGGTQTFEIGD
jgi:hypothetical protein